MHPLHRSGDRNHNVCARGRRAGAPRKALAVLTYAAFGFASSLSPSASRTLRTVSNSGRVSPFNDRYKFSRDRPACRATSAMPRARAAVPIRHSLRRVRLAGRQMPRRRYRRRTGLSPVVGCSLRGSAARPRSAGALPRARLARSRSSLASARIRSSANTNAPIRTGQAISGFVAATSRASASTRAAISASPNRISLTRPRARSALRSAAPWAGW